MANVFTETHTCGIRIRPIDKGPNAACADLCFSVAKDEGKIYVFCNSLKVVLGNCGCIRVVATLDQTQTLTNKTIGDTNTINAQSDAFTIQDATTSSKTAVFNLACATACFAVTFKSAHTAARTITFPDATDTLVGRATTDTLTNKTLTTPTITSPVLNGCISGTAFLDEDNFCSNSATKLASQQSIKAYVDAQVGASSLCVLDKSCGAMCIDLDSETFKITGGGGVTTAVTALCNLITITADHDAICNFVANEHIDHTTVSITAGTGLSGGGTIAATRTLNVCIASETAVCGAVATGDELIINDISACVCAGAIKKITVGNLSPAIDHDAATNFVANEHVDHTSVCVIAGAGMTGGGDISASRTLNVIGTANEICVSACAVGIADCPVLPGTGAVQVPAGTTCQRPCAATNGDFRYNSTQNIFEGYQNCAWGTIGGSCFTGSINFYTLGNAECATVCDFNTGNNATFDGGGCIAGTFSITTSACDLIRGCASFKYVSAACAASNTNDYIASTPIDIPKGYRGRHIGIILNYKWDGTNCNIKWVVKDTTTTCLLTDGTQTLVAQNSNGVAKEYRMNIYVPETSTQIEIGPQVVTGEASKTLIWDDVIVTPDPFVISDFDNITDYKTSSVTANWTTNTTLTSYEKQIGDEKEYVVKLTFCGAPDLVDLQFTLPTGDVIDDTKLASPSSLNAHLGLGMLDDTGTKDYPSFVRYNSTTTVKATTQIDDGSNIYVAAIDRTNPFTVTNGDSMWFRWRVPIVGLTSKTQHVVTPTRMAQPARATVNDTSGINSATVVFVSFDNTDFDDDSLFTNLGATSNTTYTSASYWTAPHDGKFRVASQVYFADADFDSGEYIEIRINVNGTKVAQNIMFAGGSVANPYYTPYINAVIDVNKDDKVSISIEHNTAGTMNPNGTAGYSYFEVTQIDTVPVLGAIPGQVYLEAKTNAGTCVTGDCTNVPFTTIVYDSHCAFACGVFTVPYTGFYNIEGMMNFTSSANRTMKLYVDGSYVRNMNRNLTSNSYTKFSGGVYVTKNQTIAVRSSATATLSASNENHWLTISKG